MLFLGMLGLECWFHMRNVHHVSRRGWPESSSCTEMFFLFFFSTVHRRIASLKVFIPKITCTW